jgi:hypothetical protein
LEYKALELDLEWLLMKSSLITNEKVFLLAELNNNSFAEFSLNLIEQENTNIKTKSEIILETLGIFI